MYLLINFVALGLRPICCRMSEFRYVRCQILKYCLFCCAVCTRKKFLGLHVSTNIFRNIQSIVWIFFSDPVQAFLSLPGTCSQFAILVKEGAQSFSLFRPFLFPRFTIHCKDFDHFILCKLYGSMKKKIQI